MAPRPASSLAESGVMVRMGSGSSEMGVSGAEGKSNGSLMSSGSGP